jgi:hypothetical protein
MILRRDRARLLAGLNGAGRSALGIVALTLPGLPLAPWVGAAKDDPAARLLAQAVGGRDLAIGLGTLDALRRGRPVGGWLAAGGIADAGDVLVTVLRWRQLPAIGRAAVAAAAAGGVVSALISAGSVDDPPSP